MDKLSPQSCCDGVSAPFVTNSINNLASEINKLNMDSDVMDITTPDAWHLNLGPNITFNRIHSEKTTPQLFESNENIENTETINLIGDEDSQKPITTTRSKLGRMLQIISRKRCIEKNQEHIQDRRNIRTKKKSVVDVFDVSLKDLPVDVHTSTQIQSTERIQQEMKKLRISDQVSNEICVNAPIIISKIKTKQNIVGSSENKCTLRKRIHQSESEDDCKKMQEIKAYDVENYYRDTAVNRLPPSLETIYEEPRNGKVMSGWKYKRVIHFNRDTIRDRSKVRKLRLRAYLDRTLC